ncbi:hypothetical protein GX51_00417 [Blastomyces parvus]|uniref:Protein kinase domain-containing protein n=1 Tax=Blastomyces parvus TaxID=2060905 RepID=A0A2B7XMF5_9EURO|nr:hypothetical protein GX51_00417 [Blastomyces parvus]
MSAMQICEQSEAFVELDGSPVFDHTKLILRRDDEFFYARANWRETSGRKWTPRYTPAPDPLPPNPYIKQPSLLYLGNTSASFEPGRQVLAEVDASEVLRSHPHPNIARYLGCVTENGRIMGLCFAKYPRNLLQRLKEPTPINRTRCLEGIESSVRHMHDLRLIHNDVNPSNIMIDKMDNPVSIDFDSCQKEGNKLGLESGTIGWAMESPAYARKENDFFGLSKVREFLMGDGGEKEHSHDVEAR